MSKPKTKARPKAGAGAGGGDQVFMLGDHIWIEPVSDREFDVALGARVIAKLEGTRIQVYHQLVPLHHCDIRGRWWTTMERSSGWRPSGGSGRCTRPRSTGWRT